MNAPQTYLERAAQLIPAIAARASETDGLRKLPPATIAAMKAAGLHRMSQPARFGGAERPFSETIDVVAALARGCASSAWVCGLWNDHAIILSKFDPRAAQDVWGNNPDAVVSAGYIPSGTVEKVEGGYRIAGTWGFASGCDYADWIMVGSMLPHEGGHPMPSLCLVPRAECVIDDNWHFLGLAGTGSKNIVIKSTLVPAYRTLPLPLNNLGLPPGRAENGLLAHLPHAAVVPFHFVATGIGTAESLLAMTIEALSGKASVVGAPLAELQSMQLRIAESAAEIDCARMLIQRDVTEAMAAIQAGRALTLQEKARNRRDQGYAAMITRRAVDRLFAMSGARGMFQDHAAQRKFRDVCAVSSHIITSWDIAATTYGRVSLGLDPATMFI
jgi:resorcinol 4-hydroxylase (FADH2)